MMDAMTIEADGELPAGGESASKENKETPEDRLARLEEEIRRFNKDREMLNAVMAARGRSLDQLADQVRQLQREWEIWLEPRDRATSLRLSRGN